MPHLICIALIGLASLSSSSCAYLARLEFPAEQVVLANCQSSTGVKSSQMAYYNASVGPSPRSVGNVLTSPGQTALWEGSGPVSGVFFDTTFTANIPAVVAQGQYAGQGENLYRTTFNCWYNYSLNLYHWGDGTCDQVYDCNHQEAPAIAAPASPQLQSTAASTTPVPSPNASSTTATASAASSSSSSSSSTATTTSSSTTSSTTSSSPSGSAGQCVNYAHGDGIYIQCGSGNSGGGSAGVNRGRVDNTNDAAPKSGLSHLQIAGIAIGAVVGLVTVVLTIVGLVYAHKTYRIKQNETSV